MGKAGSKGARRATPKRGVAGRKGRSSAKRAQRKNRRAAADGRKVRLLEKANEELAIQLASLKHEKEELESECSRLSGEMGRLLRRPRPEEARVVAGPAAGKGEAAEGAEPESFWREKSLDELAEEQGVRPVACLEEVLGRGASLWESDEEFDDFLNGIAERRRDGERP